MSELSREDLLAVVRDVWERHDPVPEHLVAAMQATAAIAASDLDAELMELVERSTELVVTESGRFELTGLPLGLLRLRLEPHDATRPAFATPTFEI